ncbi:MAG: 5'/3'-nucleotidase SurE [Planctomycetaceae bacterium]|jgi:5'-nucleotidase|nr:5'/3'-nucleotidase SurE [Planctomycetaceae bacterium]
MTTENLSLQKKAGSCGVRNIVLTNDDGIYAPGLAAMGRALCRLGNVYVVAPSREQSGVSHSVTFLTPLMVRNVFIGDEHWGWAVDGSPADCVKFAIAEILPDLPDLVVSGINGGLNAGTNVLYSGTVAAAVEAAFYGVTSFAVSLEHSKNESFRRAADIAADVIENVLQQIEDTQNNNADNIDNPITIYRTSGGLYNLNIPVSALSKLKPEVQLTELDMVPDWDSFESRVDPMGRPYYWLSSQSDPRQSLKRQPEYLTDIVALKQGFVTLSPLSFNLTDKIKLQKMESWQTSNWDLSAKKNTNNIDSKIRPNAPSIKTTLDIKNFKNQNDGK